MNKESEWQEEVALRAQHWVCRVRDVSDLKQSNGRFQASKRSVQHPKNSRQENLESIWPLKGLRQLRSVHNEDSTDEGDKNVWKDIVVHYIPISR